MLHRGLAFVALAHLPSPTPFPILYSGNFFAQGNFWVLCCPAPTPASAARHRCTQFPPSPPQTLLLSDRWATSTIIHPLIHERRTP